MSKKSIVAFSSVVLFTGGVLSANATTYQSVDSFSFAIAATKKAKKGDLKKGKKLYLKSCASCHGKTGKADTATGKALKARNFVKGKYKFGSKDKELAKSIKKGKGKMPGFKKLTNDEVTNLIAFIRSLKKK